MGLLMSVNSTSPPDAMWKLGRRDALWKLGRREDNRKKGDAPAIPCHRASPDTRSLTECVTALAAKGKLAVLHVSDHVERRLR
jgi:hypothetical protein